MMQKDVKFIISLSILQLKRVKTGLLHSEAFSCFTRRVKHEQHEFGLDPEPEGVFKGFGEHLVGSSLCEAHH